MKILFATGNAHKVVEVRAILAGSGIEMLTLEDFPEIGELPETHETFEENAIEKARAAHELTGLVAVADDSGIEVDALDGRPGVHSKRFSEQGTDEGNNRLLIRLLDGREDRAARYRCVVAVVVGPQELTAEGRCEGVIGHEYRGQGGFGYDPLFWPDEVEGRAMAELTMDDKNAISHRGRAFRQLPELLGEGAAMSGGRAQEIGLYVEQVEDLLRRAAELDPDEAVELAGLAGMLMRLGADGAWRVRAESWRDGKGRHVLVEGLEGIDGDEILEELDAGITGEGDAEDALYDVDEVILAAWWARRTDSVRVFAEEVVKRVVARPDVFADLSAYAVDLLDLPGLSEDHLASSVWVAIAEAAERADLQSSDA